MSKRWHWRQQRAFLFFSRSTTFFLRFAERRDSIERSADIMFGWFFGESVKWTHSMKTISHTTPQRREEPGTYLEIISSTTSSAQSSNSGCTEFQLESRESRYPNGSDASASASSSSESSGAKAPGKTGNPIMNAADAIGCGEGRRGLPHSHSHQPQRGGVETPSIHYPPSQALIRAISPISDVHLFHI